MKSNKFLILLIFIILFELLVLRRNQALPSKSIEQYANEVLEKCASSSHHQSCYDKEIPLLMDKPASLTMEQAFEVTREVQAKDSSFPYCHVLGHNLSAKEVRKDPSRWKEVVTRCPSGLCSNGCIHGGFQEKFRAESFSDEQIRQVKPDLLDLCEKRGKWNPTGLEQASCYHALGHLTMYLTSADINKSIKLCEEIAVKVDGRNFLQVCLDGSFMQIYQPLEPEDFALIKGKEVSKDKVDSFCAGFWGHAKASCLSESWPLYRQDLINNPNELVKFCSKEAKDAQSRCFEGLFYVLTAQFNFDLSKIQNYCLKLPSDVQKRCYANAASRMIETDYRNISKSVDLCQSAPINSQSACFDELLKYSTYNFHAGSSQFYSLCNGLPQPWKTKCLNKS